MKYKSSPKGFGLQSLLDEEINANYINFIGVHV